MRPTSFSEVLTGKGTIIYAVVIYQRDGVMLHVQGCNVVNIVCSDAVNAMQDRCSDALNPTVNAFVVKRFRW